MAFVTTRLAREPLLFGGFDSTFSDDYLGDTWAWDCIAMV
jgi:hypothetical protein